MTDSGDVPERTDVSEELTSVLNLRPRWETWCVAVLLVYFFARMLYFAISIAPGIPPDEPTHLGIIGLYAEAPLLIEDSPESYGFGLVTRQPHLYYFTLGKLAALNVFGMDEVLYLRLINVVLAMMTVLAGYRLASRLTGNPLVRIVFLVMATNTLMFTFIGGAVSYDNLVNLLAVLSISAFIAFIQDENPVDLLLFLLWNFLGTLTKTTFLPLTLVLAVLYLLTRRRHLWNDFQTITRLVRAPPKGPKALLGIVILVFGANAWLYGSNLVKYGRPVPSCDQVLELDECGENRIFTRNWILGQYRDQELTFEQALQATSRIRHPGDRDHAVRLLQNERAFKKSTQPMLPRWDYIGLVWTQAMKPTIYGVQAHLSILKDPWSLLPYNVILFAAFVVWIRWSRWDGSEKPWSALSIAVVFYFLFLIGYVNYKSYLASHAAFLGVQGRYLFPVLVPAYLTAARFLFNPFRRAVQIALLLIVSTIFILGDFPYFLRHDGPDWYAKPPHVETSAGNPRPSR